jgi:hypothetical protein
MQRLLLAAIAALAVAGLVGATGYSAEPPDADVGAPTATGPAGEISVQPPRDLRDIALAAKPRLSERRPSVAANPADPRRLTISFAAGGGRCVVRRSSDAGRTWSAPVVLPQPVGSSASCYYADLAYAPDGARLFAAYTASAALLVASRSDDDGKTWRSPTIVGEGGTDGPYFLLPNLATPLQAGNRDVVYLTANARYNEPGLSVVFARSTDGGESWGGHKWIASGDGVDTVVGGRVAGGNGGEVLISWYETYLEGLSVMRSPDYGENFDPPVRVATDYAGYASDVAVGRAGVAHLVYERRSRQPLKDFGDIGYTWSPPPYTTWAAPVTISDTARPRQQSEPSLAVKPCGSGSLLHVIWRDSRLSPVADPRRLSDIYYARKLARPGALWSSNVRISDQSSLDDGAYYYIGRQPEIAGGTGRVFAVWTDRRDKTSSAYTETDVYGSGILSGITCP